MLRRTTLFWCLDAKALERGSFARSYLAQSAALTALLSRNPAEQSHYANIAFDALWAIQNDPDPGDHTLLGTSQHLSKAGVAMGFAMSYEWVYAFWTQQQRDWVRGQMITALNGWVNLSHPNFAGSLPPTGCPCCVVLKCA
ncbi:MAG: hypothetical protein LR015_14480 [Verrucomicrobia bacterium]|nr:hypothetical protein [Verrucomicrobiota bacterium]